MTNRRNDRDDISFFGFFSLCLRVVVANGKDQFLLGKFSVCQNSVYNPVFLINNLVFYVWREHDFFLLIYDQMLILINKSETNHFRKPFLAHSICNYINSLLRGVNARY